MARLEDWLEELADSRNHHVGGREPVTWSPVWWLLTGVGAGAALALFLWWIG